MFIHVMFMINVSNYSWSMFSQILSYLMGNSGLSNLFFIDVWSMLCYQFLFVSLLFTIYINGGLSTFLKTSGHVCMFACTGLTCLQVMSTFMEPYFLFFQCYNISTHRRNGATKPYFVFLIAHPNLVKQHMDFLTF